jgi:hypothetical protein
MPTTNLSTNVDATYPDVPADPSVQAHQADHDKAHRIVNYAAVVLRWDPVTDLWETRPAGVPYGVTAISTNDPTAVAPHTQSQTGFVTGDVWEWHPDGGPA